MAGITVVQKVIEIIAWQLWRRSLEYIVNYKGVRRTINLFDNFYRNIGIQIAILLASVCYLVDLSYFHPILYSGNLRFILVLTLMLCLWGRVWSVMLVFLLLFLSIVVFGGRYGGAQNYEIASTRLQFIAITAMMSCIIVFVRNFVISLYRE